MQPDETKQAALKAVALDWRKPTTVLALVLMTSLFAVGYFIFVVRQWIEVRNEAATVVATANVAAAAIAADAAANELASFNMVTVASAAVFGARTGARIDDRPAGVVFIPGGTFEMGSPTNTCRHHDDPQKTVTVAPFYLSRTEVTQAEWNLLTGGVNPSYFQTPYCSWAHCESYENDNDNAPVEQVDWYSALAFANAMSEHYGRELCYELVGCEDPLHGWKDGVHAGCSGANFAGSQCTGYRLPTEAEWEYAARAGTTAATYAGDLRQEYCEDRTLREIAWFCGNSQQRTHAVRAKRANPFGLYDMLGNVAEWTSDPKHATNHHPANRGGSWHWFANRCRSAYRNESAPDYRNDAIGFRLAASYAAPSLRQ